MYFVISSSTSSSYCLKMYKITNSLKKKANALFGSISSVFVSVATVVRSDLSSHGKVIRNARAVPDSVFISVMKVLWPPGIC